MAAAHREKLKALFDEALALPPEQRPAFLDEACQGDATLREELTSLLAHYNEAPAFFESLAGAVLPHAQGDEPPASPEPDLDRLIGQTVSHYHIEEKLGGGGMGVVYKALDTKLDRPVALKFLPPHLSMDGEAKARFIHEAKAASALDHVNIGYIHEIDETAEGQLFIAMAYYAGDTLKKKIARGPLMVEEALDYATQVAEGLAAAHEAGIVHRDVKPANVMVTHKGWVKIVDFGLAKVAEQTLLTKSGMTLGTVSYMSPEQARGQEVDHRTDMWSLGVVLYEMLTGERPFRGDYEQAVIYSVLNVEPEPISALRPEVPESLAQVVEKLLKKEQAQRYGSVTALLEDLDDFRGVTSAAAVAQPKAGVDTASSKRRWIQVGVPAVLLGVLGLVWAFMKVGPTASVEALEAPPRTAVAVLPFTVRGSEELAYLEEGMVDLLSTMLDGAGTLRSIDAKALLGFIARNPDRVLDPQGGREIAAHFGAGSFILGTVMSAGSETRLLASLYDVDGEERKQVQASFGREEEFMEAVDALAQQLVAGYLEGSDQPLASVVETTSSFAALKAYLEGEQAQRDGRYEEALEAARRAVAEDSTFALAWYVLMRAAAWQSLIPESDTAAARTLQYSDALPGRAKMLSQAGVAQAAGNLDEAERLYRATLRSYPDNIDAWGGLGTMLYHANPIRGRPASEAREPFERVLFYDPDNKEYLYHLMRIVAKEREYAVLDSLALRFLESGRDEHYIIVGLRDTYGLIRGSPETQDSIRVSWCRAGIVNMWFNLISSEHLEAAQRLAAACAQEGRLPEVRALSAGLQLMTAVSRGQGLASPTQHVPNAQQSPVLGVILRLLPFQSPSPAVLDSLERHVTLWDTTAVPYTYKGELLHPGRHAEIKEYLLGLLRWRRGDMTGMLGYAEKLRHRSQTKGNLAYSFARTLDALAAWHQDQPEQALKALDDAQFQPHWWDAVQSAFSYQALNRYVRAEVLYEQERYEEALPWYASLHDGYGYWGMFYLGLSYLRRAEIYENLGDTENAIKYYTRFLELWRDADPELQSDWVEPARQRLERLLEGTVREPGEVVRPGGSS